MFAFTVEPDNLAKWQTVKTYVTPLREGPPGLDPGLRVLEHRGHRPARQPRRGRAVRHPRDLPQRLYEIQPLLSAEAA